MTARARAMGVAALASLPVIPMAWFVALQGHPVWMSGAYLGYLVLVIGFPGTVFWRRLTGGTGWFMVDVVLGTTLGLAIEALLYPLGRWVDIPLVVLVMPALALGMVRAFPTRGLDIRRTPWWAVAGVMVAVGVAAAWFVRVGSRLLPVSGPAALRPNSDAPHHLALAGELANHFPPQVPYASGKPLTTHWGVYDHLASAHWITSVELDVLTYQFAPFAFLLLTALGGAAAGVVLTRRSVAAPIGAGLVVVAGDLTAWPAVLQDRLFTESPFSFSQLSNPAQAFSTVLVLPLIAVTALLLRRDVKRTRLRLVGLFVVAGLLIAALSLAKASALPVYAVGLAAAWTYLTVQAGRLNLRALVLGVGVAAAFALSFVLLLHGATTSTRYVPGKTFERMATALGDANLLAVAAVVVLGWILPAVAGLLIRRKIHRDPMVVLLTAGLLGAVVGASLLYHDGQAQLYFVRSGFIYAVLLATWGLGSLERRQLYFAAPALLAGAAAMYWGRYRSEDTCQSAACTAQPLAVALVSAVLCVVLLGLVTRRPLRTWPMLLVVALLGLTVAPTLTSVREFARPPVTEYESITPGGIEGARFIRRNSGSNDVIATNVHCHRIRASHCLTGSYWISGYAERRVLVQGWSYVTRVDDTYPGRVQGPYWDQDLLRLNNQAISKPTRELLERLRTEYNVHWILVDTRAGTASEDLKRYTELRFDYGSTRVYQLKPPPPANPFPIPTPSSPTGTPPTGSPTTAPTGSPTRPTGSPTLPTGSPTVPSTNPSQSNPSQSIPTQSFPTQSFPTQSSPTQSIPTTSFNPSTPPRTPSGVAP